LKKCVYPDDDLEQVVLQITADYVEQAQSGQKPSLSDYLVRYPAYTDAIVDFVAYYHALEEQISQRKDTSVASETLSAVSLLALEYVWQRVYLTGQRGPSQVLTLLVRKDQQPLSLSYLATELDLSVDIVMQLELRRIDPVSIPLALFRHLAQVLQRPLHAVQAYFTGYNQYGTPGTSRSAVYQSVAESPETYAVSAAESMPRLAFCQALHTSTQMSERQKALWCAIIEHEDG
jgi:hypothetical protein